MRTAADLFSYLRTRRVTVVIAQQYSLQPPANLIGGKWLKGRRVCANPRAPFAAGSAEAWSDFFASNPTSRRISSRGVRSRFMHDYASLDKDHHYSTAKLCRIFPMHI